MTHGVMQGKVVGDQSGCNRAPARTRSPSSVSTAMMQTSSRRNQSVRKDSRLPWASRTRLCPSRALAAAPVVRGAGHEDDGLVHLRRAAYPLNGGRVGELSCKSMVIRASVIFSQAAASFRDMGATAYACVCLWPAYKPITGQARPPRSGALSTSTKASSASGVQRSISVKA